MACGAVILFIMRNHFRMLTAVLLASAGLAWAVPDSSSGAALHARYDEFKDLVAAAEEQLSESRADEILPEREPTPSG